MCNARSKGGDVSFSKSKLLVKFLKATSAAGPVRRVLYVVSKVFTFHSVSWYVTG